jgi:hypothetical protein
MAQCPECGVQVPARKVPITLGLPTWQCEHCSAFLEWQEPENTRLGLFLLLFAGLLWWFVGMSFGKPEGPAALLWLAWTGLMLAAFLAVWNRLAPVSSVRSAQPSLIDES